ncbi:MAG: hypothetical protein AVDCRST_MAG30-3636 [uncultured Solirubrobacteraceae bacterium]|uniref:Uncharacterized protein n=1 Tax=uncultured Solirubrobacteraceae bacterium TaxID=1162706 RepID=A0A6J4TPK8_9ACTN|nr:MAG: hypothetical protein AVDCRST_MAG30-3636 [uncultured Solirubrobacteraceae bacterium]
MQRSLGPAWAERVAAGVRAGESRSSEAAIAVSGAVALQDALAGLRAP